MKLVIEIEKTQPLLGEFATADSLRGEGFVWMSEPPPLFSPPHGEKKRGEKERALERGNMLGTNRKVFNATKHKGPRAKARMMTVHLKKKEKRKVRAMPTFNLSSSHTEPQIVFRRSGKVKKKRGERR